MGTSPYQQFLKKTASDNDTLNKAMEAIRQSLRDLQSSSKATKLSDVPTSKITVLQNNYLDTGPEGSKITKALDRLDHAWEIDSINLGKSGAALKKRKYHMTLRVSYESFLNKLSEELNGRT